MTMVQTLRSCLNGPRTLAVAILVGFLTLSLPAEQIDIQLPTLKSGTDVYTNVTVYGKSETDLFIKHARGFGNVKINSLDAPTLRALGMGAGLPEETTGEATSDDKSFGGIPGNFQGKEAIEKAILDKVSALKAIPNILAIFFACVLVFHLITSWVMKRICVNAGSEPGILVWIPVLQMFPLLRAAGMSGWWFLAFFVPLLNILVQIIWIIKIAQACGKGGLTILCLLLPGINIFGFLYLALSSNERVEESGPMKMSGQVGAALGES